MPLMAEEAADSTTIVDRINSMGYVEVIQPKAMQLRLMRNTAAEQGHGVTARTSQPNSRSGYRIQIYDSNSRGARNEAQGRKNAVETRSKMNAYVTFDSPYWRVRVGDFHTRAEAEHALSELRRLFPGSSASFRIVRDRINP